MKIENLKINKKGECFDRCKKFLDIRIGSMNCILCSHNMGYSHAEKWAECFLEGDDK